MLVPAPALAQQAPALVPAPVPAAAAAAPQLQVQAPERQVPARGRRGAGAPGARWRRRRRRRGGGGDPAVVARGDLSRRRPRGGSTAPPLGLPQLGSAGRCQVRSFCDERWRAGYGCDLCDRCGSGAVDMSNRFSGAKFLSRSLMLACERGLDQPPASKTAKARFPANNQKHGRRGRR